MNVARIEYRERSILLATQFLGGGIDDKGTI